MPESQPQQAEATVRKQTDENPERETHKSIDTTTTTTPRSVIIIPRGKPQATSRRVAPTSITDGGAVSSTEKRLPNGDLYIGTFSNNTPHGSGKYLWEDGCMYEGDWKKGKASGKGKFSWPSGATFEGEFKSGRMEGTGTFIGPDGDTYRGSWSGDRKHGYGVKHYSNGDYYEGQWKRNFQDGRGRYVWSNGNEYIGEWKNGIIHGRGVLVWNNKNRFDGNWENGVPKGQGVFTWPDGSCYMGSWSNDLCSNASSKAQILNGTFYPAHSARVGSEEGWKGCFSQKLSAPLMVVGEEGGVAVAGGGKKRICVWESDGEAGDITCDIIDNAVFNQDGGVQQFRRNPCCFSGEAMKPGVTISKGHKNYELMLNLQLGIRHTVGKHASNLRDLKLSDFESKEKFWTRFPSQGLKISPLSFGGRITTLLCLGNQEFGVRLIL